MTMHSAMTHHFTEIKWTYIDVHCVKKKLKTAINHFCGEIRPVLAPYLFDFFKNATMYCKSLKICEQYLKLDLGKTIKTTLCDVFEKYYLVGDSVFKSRLVFVPRMPIADR